LNDIVIEESSAMKSYFLRPDSGKTVLELRDAPQPEPGPGQILVRMRAAGLNRGELIVGHSVKAGGAAKAAGGEGAGEVAELGQGVAGFKPGDRVMGRCSGSFAEYALMDAREAMAVPKNLSWEEAACIPLVFCVVHDMLVAQGKLKAGEWLLVTGISAGVGVAALQTGKALGAKVIGTSGSAEKLEKLKALGLDLGIRTRSADFCDAVMKATGGKGANLVVNNVGGSVFAETIRALAYEGRHATVGYVDGVLKSELDIEALHTKRLTLFGVSNRLRTAEQRAVTVRGFAADILPFIADGRIRPAIDRTFDFGDLPAAKDYMETNAHLGKIAVRIGG
jgi:NADPH:quinone reductase